MNSTRQPQVSIVIPVFEELENIPILYDEIKEVMGRAELVYEVLFVDDGSRDGTVERLKELAADDRVKLLLFRRNYGQTAAMHAGIKHARGQYIVTMDGDLQNDPRDIPMMIQRLEEGYDLVHGWRRARKDKWLSRRLPSMIANWIISRSTRFPIHDLGCTLKAMRREIAQEMELYGDMHRFIPILADQLGARCIEVETHHRARQFGRTKYGIGRTFRVVLDLMTVLYMQRFFAKPMRFFGSVGLWTAAASGLAITAALFLKLVWHADMTGNPLLMIGVITSVLSVQFFSLGLLGEVASRIYFGQPQNRNYRIRQTMNLAEATPGQTNPRTETVDWPRAA